MNAKEAHEIVLRHLPVSQIRPLPGVVRLCRHRTVAHVALDERERPCAVEVPLSSGDVLRIETPAEVRRFRRTLECCEDQLRQAGRRR